MMTMIYMKMSKMNRLQKCLFEIEGKPNFQNKRKNKLNKIIKTKTAFCHIKTPKKPQNPRK